MAAIGTGIVSLLVMCSNRYYALVLTELVKAGWMDETGCSLHGSPAARARLDTVMKNQLYMHRRKIKHGIQG
jgi:hypothetical protein